MEVRSSPYSSPGCRGQDNTKMSMPPKRLSVGGDKETQKRVGSRPDPHHVKTTVGEGLPSHWETPCPESFRLWEETQFASPIGRYRRVLVLLKGRYGPESGFIQVRGGAMLGSAAQPTPVRRHCPAYLLPQPRRPISGWIPPGKMVAYRRGNIGQSTMWLGSLGTKP